MVPWHHGTMIQWYHGTMAPWYHDTMVPLYHDTMVPWYRVTMTPWYHVTMVPWYHGTHYSKLNKKVCGTKCPGQGPESWPELSHPKLNKMGIHIPHAFLFEYDLNTFGAG